MDRPQINTQLVYTTVANTLPQEGRDFRIDAEYGEDGKTKVVLTPLNALGRAWIPFLRDGLTSPLSADGVSVAEGGVVAAETVTVNTIREQVEKDAEEALKKKIQAAEAKMRDKQNAAGDARKEQVSVEGKDARPNALVVRASRDAESAAKDVMRLKQVYKKVPEIRARINKEAEKAAIADKEHGQSWDVDMSAPLTSLFDRQDVANKIGDKESIIQDIASHSVAIDEMEKSAVYLAKQYIMQKGA